jgi:hypothetical protein
MRVILSLLICIELSACNPPATDQKDATFSLERLSRIEARLDKIERDQKIVDERHDFTEKFLGFRIDGLENQGAIVSTDNQDFGVAHTRYGTFTVAAEKVEPYLDGYKITLRFGNLSAAMFGGAKVTVDWGPNGLGSEREYQVPLNFLPGRYTEYEFALTPAKAADVKEITVSLDFTQVTLNLPAQ